MKITMGRAVFENKDFKWNSDIIYKTDRFSIYAGEIKDGKEVPLEWLLKHQDEIVEVEDNHEMIEVGEGVSKCRLCDYIQDEQ